MTWTRFMDMYSGGGSKEPQSKILIEAPEAEAKVIFYNRFGHNPDRVTCTCCGNDYSIDDYETLEQATAFDRGCRYAYFRPDGTECEENEGWVPGKGQPKGYTSRYVEEPGTKFTFNKYQPLAEYLGSSDVLVIRAEEIKPEERSGDIPKQGYVWVD